MKRHNSIYQTLLLSSQIVFLGYHSAGFSTEIDSIANLNSLNISEIPFTKIDNIQLVNQSNQSNQSTKNNTSLNTLSNVIFAPVSQNYDAKNTDFVEQQNNYVLKNEVLNSEFSFNPSINDDIQIKLFTWFHRPKKVKNDVDWFKNNELVSQKNNPNFNQNSIFPIGLFNVDEPHKKENWKEYIKQLRFSLKTAPLTAEQFDIYLPDLDAKKKVELLKTHPKTWEHVLRLIVADSQYRGYNPFWRKSEYSQNPFKLKKINITLPNNLTQTNDKIIEQTVQKNIFNKGVEIGLAVGEAENTWQNYLPNQTMHRKTLQGIKDMIHEVFTPFPNVKVTIYDAQYLAKEGYHLILSVGLGQEKYWKETLNDNNAPFIAVVEYNYKNNKTVPTIFQIGKGIVFDSGGVNLKTDAKSIKFMQNDLQGAMSVLAATQVAAKTNLPVNLKTAVAFSYNKIGEMATLPGTLIKTKSGKLVHIGNTDAEGRLVMADAASLLKEKYQSEQPTAIISVATLTGAKRQALGGDATGIITRNQQLGQKALTLAEQFGLTADVFPITQKTIDLISHENKATYNLTNDTSKDLAYDIGLIDAPFDTTNKNHHKAMSAAAGAFAFEFLPKNWQKNAIHLDVAGAFERQNKQNGFSTDSIPYGLNHLFALIEDLATPIVDEK